MPCNLVWNPLDSILSPGQTHAITRSHNVLVQVVMWWRIVHTACPGKYVEINFVVITIKWNITIWMFLVSSCSCLCSIHWSQVLSRKWRCSWSSADRRCSNYIWEINNLWLTKVAYVRGLTVYNVFPVNWYDILAHIGDNCSTSTGAIVWLPCCPGSNEAIWRYGLDPNHTKAQQVANCVAFLQMQYTCMHLTTNKLISFPIVDIPGPEIWLQTLPSEDKCWGIWENSRRGRKWWRQEAADRLVCTRR